MHSDQDPVHVAGQESSSGEFASAHGWLAAQEQRQRRPAQQQGVAGPARPAGRSRAPSPGGRHCRTGAARRAAHCGGGASSGGGRGSGRGRRPRSGGSAGGFRRAASQPVHGAAAHAEERGHGRAACDPQWQLAARHRCVRGHGGPVRAVDAGALGERARRWRDRHLGAPARPGAGHRVAEPDAVAAARSGAWIKLDIGQISAALAALGDAADHKCAGGRASSAPVNAWSM